MENPDKITQKVISNAEVAEYEQQLADAQAHVCACKVIKPLGLVGWVKIKVIHVPGIILLRCEGCGTVYRQETTSFRNFRCLCPGCERVNNVNQQEERAK